METKKHTEAEIEALEQKQIDFCNKAIPRLEVQAKYAELLAKITTCNLQTERAASELAKMKAEVAEIQEEANKAKK